MKELLIHMGHLIALKQLNRDNLAESLGMTRQNLIASVKGRRPLPKQYLPQLSKLLYLDDSYLLKTDHVHILSVSNATKQYNDCYTVINNFLVAPLEHIALLHGIGEKKQAFAYILRDKRGVYVLLRNDEKILAYIETSTINTASNANNTNKASNIKNTNNMNNMNNNSSSNSHNILDNTNLHNLFSHASYPMEREITNTHFERIFREGIGPEELNTILKHDVKVWTWARVCDKADSMGISPDEIAKKLNLEV